MRCFARRLVARPVMRVVVVAMALALPASGVWAQAPGATPAATASPSPTTASQERPLWELGIGAGVLSLPHYRGSDQSHTWLLPVPYFVYRGDILKADRSGARAVLFESARIDFDLSVGAGAPTRSKDNDARRGMDDLPPTVELGPNLNLTLARGARWKFDVRLPVRAAFSVEGSPRHTGFLAKPNLNLDLRLPGGWNLGLEGAAVLADRRFNAFFYEVSPEHATDTRPAYRARGGYGGLQGTLALSRRQGRLWTGAFLKVDHLNGAVFADSPLVREHRQWSAGVAAVWVFATSSRSVPASE